ncbi:unnamed protein product, partial [Allacma fusca]
ITGLTHTSSNKLSTNLMDNSDKITKRPGNGRF